VGTRLAGKRHALVVLACVQQNAKSRKHSSRSLQHAITCISSVMEAKGRVRKDMGQATRRFAVRVNA
jgi:hypothetical protein